MIYRPVLCVAMLLAAGYPPALATPPAKSGRIPVEKPSDLPVHTYAIQVRPSEVAQDYKAAVALAAEVEKDLKRDLEAYDVRDKASLTSLHTTLYVTTLVKKDFVAAGKHLERVRGLQENGMGKLMAGLFTGPLIQAMEAPGADLHATYRTLLSKRLAELPFKDVEGSLDRTRKGQKAASKEQIISPLAAALDPQVKGGKLTQDLAGSILSAAMTLHITLPMKEDVVACLEGLFEAHKADGSLGKITRTPLGTTALNAKGVYFGQPLPGETPVPFAPEILKAVSPWVGGIAFSKDGTECFLHVGDAIYNGANMYQSTCVNGAWTPLMEPSFLAGFAFTAEPVFSQDGNTLMFTAKKAGGSTDFWTVSRTGTGWGAPINALSYDGDPCIAPDGRFLVYYAGRANGFGRVDLYVTFSDGKGGWGPAINLGPTFNSPDDEFGACLSHDGKFLFFTRHTAEGDKLYWVAVSAIDKLKP